MQSQKEEQQKIQFAKMEEWQAIHALNNTVQQTKSTIPKLELGKLVELCPKNTLFPKSHYQMLANIAFSEEDQLLIIHTLRLDYALSALGKNLEVTKDKLLKISIILPNEIQEEFKTDIDVFGVTEALTNLQKFMSIQKEKLETFAQSFTFTQAFNCLITLNNQYKEAYKNSETNFFETIKWPQNAETLRKAGFTAFQNYLEALNTVDEKIKLCESVLTFPLFCKPYNMLHTETLISEIKAIEESLKTTTKNEDALFQCDM